MNVVILHKHMEGLGLGVAVSLVICLIKFYLLKSFLHFFGCIVIVEYNDVSHFRPKYQLNYEI